ncbi:ABC transporter permease [Microbacterium ulmi]|uniref:ABC transporter permease n=1 Tax=Microbacterium ulmi TaxID=179095 RepID=A0A7Y2LZL4_9MICO|nr:ABC transporter permease [Microbacterium ulmi]NII69874.1 ABC-type spermidine/putrescine transport system permease subunit I [Microbacterium ulmi]NNH03796.1 ABC transporter permease [Microbacterium ulmi]
MTALTSTAERAALEQPVAPRPVPAVRNGHRRRELFTGMGALQIAALLFMVVAFLLPIAVIAFRALSDPNNFALAFESGIFRRSIWTTVRMSVLVTIVCVVISYPFAYVLARGGKVLVAVLGTFLLVSFWTSTLVRTYSWQLLLNNTGILNDTLIALGVIAEPLAIIRTDLAVFIGMAHVLAPYTILTIFAQIRAIPSELEEAAQVMGARPITVFWRVVLPLTRAGAVAGGVLVFVMALGFYITPQILGNQQDVYIGTAIVQQVQVFLRTDVGAAQSLVLLAIVLLVLGVAARFLGLSRVLGLDKASR